MNCANHSDVTAAAYCRTCGKPLCTACGRNVSGAVYCESCLAERVAQGTAGASYSQTVMSEGRGVPPNSPNAKPVLAAMLGLIPGVGAMYNGQFMKGILHLGVFVAMIALADRFGPIMVPVFFAYFFYCVFDAYKTAEAMQLGLPLPDPFGLERAFGGSVNQTSWHRPMPQAPSGSGASNTAPGTPQWDPAQQQLYANQPTPADFRGIPIGAVILIGLGSLFLLENLGWFTFRVHTVGPVVLIVIGAWMLYKRWTCRVS